MGGGWKFKHVFGGAGGVIFAVASNGTLYRYTHTGQWSVRKRWDKRETIGGGYLRFAKLFGGGVFNYVFGVDR